MVRPRNPKYSDISWGPAGTEQNRAAKQEYARRKRLDPDFRQWRKVAKRRWNLKSKYGLTEEQADELLARGCGICDVLATCIDHDHVTGQVRGALCARCNRSIGSFEDSPSLLRAAINYLEGVSNESNPQSN